MDPGPENIPIMTKKKKKKLPIRDSQAATAGPSVKQTNYVYVTYEIHRTSSPRA